MPLEVRELVIKTAINPSESSIGRVEQVTGAELNEETQRKLIATCVQQVLAILRSRPER